MAVPLVFQSTTDCASLPLLFPGQAQKEFFVNQSLVVIDALLQQGVSESRTVPPADPSEGQCFRILSGAGEEWAGHEHEIAVSVADAWHFVAPAAGMRFFDRGAGVFLHYDGGWQTATEPAVPDTGTTVDAEVRAALGELIEALRKVGIFANTP